MRVINRGASTPKKKIAKKATPIVKSSKETDLDVLRKYSRTAIVRALGIGEKYGWRENNVWKKIRAMKTVSDEVLTEAISHILGIQGGFGGPGTPWVEYKGGNNPSVTVRRLMSRPEEQVEIKGNELVRSVRLILRIKKG